MIQRRRKEVEKSGIYLLNMKKSWDKIQTELSFEENLFQQTKVIIAHFCSQLKEDNETFYAFAFDIEMEQGHLESMP